MPSNRIEVSRVFPSIDEVLTLYMGMSQMTALDQLFDCIWLCIHVHTPWFHLAFVVSRKERQHLTAIVESFSRSLAASVYVCADSVVKS